MKRSIFATAWVSSAFVATLAFAQAPEPRFADYAVSPTRAKAGQRVRLVLQGAEARRYAMQLAQAANRPANFAGHFILTTIGCGANCLVVGAIDVGSGIVTMLPFTVSDWPDSVSEPLTWRIDSRLLKVVGSRDERGHGTYFYRFDEAGFALILAREAAK